MEISGQLHVPAFWHLGNGPSTTWQGLWVDLKTIPDVVHTPAKNWNLGVQPELSWFKTDSVQTICTWHKIYIYHFPYTRWPPGARTANGIGLCHWVQLYHYFMCQSSEFCRHNPLSCFSTSYTKGKCIFCYQFSPGTFGYTLILWQSSSKHSFCIVSMAYNIYLIKFIHTITI